MKHLPSTQAKSAKESEITQENYSPSEMFQNLENQRTIFQPDALHSEARSKANQLNNFLYPKKNLEKKERSFLSSWYDKRTWLHRSGYCIICKNADPYNMLNDIRVGNSFIKTGCSSWKHAGSTDKGFHQHEFSN